MSVAEKVKGLLADVVDDPRLRELDDDQNLIEAGVVSSLQLTRLVLALESTFGIRLAIRDMSPTNFETVRSVTELVERRRASS